LITERVNVSGFCQAGKNGVYTLDLDEPWISRRPHYVNEGGEHLYWSRTEDDGDRWHLDGDLNPDSVKAYFDSTSAELPVGSHTWRAYCNDGYGWDWGDDVLFIESVPDFQGRSVITAKETHASRNGKRKMSHVPAPI
jgi:hypothetical protein